MARASRSLLLICAGSLLLAVSLTLVWHVGSVLGWAGNYQWDYAQGATTAAGYLCLAFAVWLVRGEAWGDPIGLGVVAVGVGVAALGGLAYLANGFVVLAADYGAFLDTGQARIGVTALAWVLVSIGWAIAWRRSASDPPRRMWRRVFACATLASILIALGELMIFGILVWTLELGTGSIPTAVVTAAFGVQAVGWLVAAAAVSAYWTGTDSSATPTTVATYGAVVLTAICFAVNSILSVVLELESRPAYTVSQVLRWLDVPTFVGWLVLGVATGFAALNLSATSSSDEAFLTLGDESPVGEC
jgi:hypothetical protein